MQIYKLLVISLVSLLLCCCSNQDEISSVVPQSDATTNTAQRLKEFNQSISQTPDSRISLIGWTSVILADGSGAYVGAKGGAFVGSLLGPAGGTVGAALGGVIVGGAASLKQHKLANQIENGSWLSNSETSDYSSTSIPSIQKIADRYALAKKATNINDFDLGYSYTKDSALISIGVLHNKLVKDLVSKQTEGSAHEKVTELGSMEKDILADKRFKEYYNEVLSDPTRIDICLNKRTDEVMRLFQDACESYATDFETNGFDRICRRYIFEIVNSKDFSKEDKNYLLSGIIVTIYSRQFWKDYILKSEE